MSKQNLAIRPKPYAQTAGALYLVIAVCGGFAIGYVPSVIYVAGDAAATAANLTDNIRLFQAGILGDIVVLLAEIVLTAMLYVLFAGVSKTLSLVAAFARLTMVVIMGFNLLLNIAPMYLVSGAGVLNAFEPAHLQAVALGFFEGHQMVTYIWQLFFGLHLLALGYMIIRSDLFPRLLGWMMFIGSFGYSLQGVVKLISVDQSLLNVGVIVLLTIGTLGELSFAFYLLIKGTKPEAAL